jgi:hypothetical protein
VGWNNGQVVETGVVTTTQALDYTYGAGALDLAAALKQYSGGTANVVGLTGGSVEAIGWDFGQVVSGVTNDYFITDELIGDRPLNLTLSWFMPRIYFDTSMTTWGDKAFDDLNVEVWRTIDDTPVSLVAQSVSLYNTTEHLSFLLPEHGQYMIRVIWAGEHFDVLNVPDEDLYGLAWSARAMPGVGDMNGDGVANLLDIDPFVLAIIDPAAYQQSYDLDPLWAGDMNDDAIVNLLDINTFVTLVTASASGTMVPEPASLSLLSVLAGLMFRRNHR